VEGGLQVGISGLKQATLRLGRLFGTEAGFVKIYIPGRRKKQLGVLNI